MRRVDELAQSGPGALLHVTPAQGSGLHWPLAHPKVDTMMPAAISMPPTPGQMASSVAAATRSDGTV